MFLLDFCLDYDGSFRRHSFTSLSKNLSNIKAFEADLEDFYPCDGMARWLQGYICTTCVGIDSSGIEIVSFDNTCCVT
jgi:hypothetical protein